MGRVMDDHIGAVVRESADALSDDNAQPPVAASEPAKGPRDRGLRGQDQKGDQGCGRIAAHQRSHLRMRSKNRASPFRMRLFKFSLVKIPLHEVSRLASVSANSNLQKRRRHNETGYEENCIQERPEINFFLA